MSVQRLHIDKFLNSLGKYPLLDIRSPAEYERGHIPGAISFPLFSNEDRAIIGTLYKQNGKIDAVKKGLEIVGPKLAEFVEMAESLMAPHLLMYCWRGGMRSDSMAWLLDKAGLDIDLLEGGYKAYRNALVDYFRAPLPLRVLTGYTGSRKTSLLHIMEHKGAQIIDLEGLAGHQGSSFGNQKTTGQPTSEHFQNLVFEAFRPFDLTAEIWIEDECHRIGQVTLPDDLFRQMSLAPHFFLEVELLERIDFLVQDYGNLPVEKLTTATRNIAKKLGYDRAATAIEHIKNGELGLAAEIILSYYDRYYLKSIARKEKLITHRISGSLNDLEQLAELLTDLKTHAVQTN